MHNFAIIGIFLFLGYVTQHQISSTTKLSNTLNNAVINIILPAVVFLYAANIQFNHDLILIMCAPWLIIFISSLIILAMSRFFHWDKATTGAVLLMATLGNTSFLGFPMLEALLGKESLKYAIIYDQIGNFLALTIFGSIVIALYASKENNPSAASIIKRIISFPPFLSLLTVLIINTQSDLLTSPATIQILTPISALLTPVTMFIIGLNFTFKIDEKHRTAFTAGLLIKMLIAPILMYALIINASDNTLLIHSLVLESAMPPMVTAAALAMRSDMQAKLCASMVGIGLILSFISLPLIHFLLVY